MTGSHHESSASPSPSSGTPAPGPVVGRLDASGTPGGSRGSVGQDDRGCEEIDRRPVGARRWRAVALVADCLIGWSVSPNAISAVGLGACLAAGVLFSLTATLDQTHPLWTRLLWASGALLVLLRGLCNVLDGMVAIGLGRASRVGELWNELPDRLSDCAMLIGLGYAVGGWPLAGWAAALGAVLTAYVRAECRAVGAPQDFCGPMAKPTRLALVAACAGAMAVLPRPWTLDWFDALRGGQGPLLDPLRDEPSQAGSILAAMGLPAAFLVVIAAGTVVTAVRRVMRASRHLSRDEQERGGS